MSVENKLYYWLVCDVPECWSELPGDGGEFTAVSECSDLELYAQDSDWLTVEGQHYCPDHASWRCRSCGAELTGPEQDAGEYQCERCRPEQERIAN